MKQYVVRFRSVKTYIIEAKTRREAREKGLVFCQENAASIGWIASVSKAVGATERCVGCKRLFPKEEMSRYGDGRMCIYCYVKLNQMCFSY